MSAICNSKRRIMPWLVATLVAACCFASIAQAQAVGEPDESDAATPPPALTQAEETAEAAVTTDEPDPIQIAEFEPPKTGGIGLYPAHQLRLPYDLWDAVSEAEAIAFIQDLPFAAQSAALQNLTLRLLTVETGRADLSKAFLNARLEALLEQGQPALAARMVENIPAKLRDQSLKERYFLARLFAGEEAERLCADLIQIQAEAPDAFWQRFRVLCQIEAGEKDEAQLGLAVLQEQNKAPEAFERLVQHLSYPDQEWEAPELTDRESWGWYAFAGLLPEQTADTPALKPWQLALYQAHEATEKLNEASQAQLQGQRFNQAQLASPETDNADVSLTSLNIDTEASEQQRYAAHLAFALRRVWDKPLSIEAEQRLARTASSRDLIELSPHWSERVTRHQEAQKRLLALGQLIAPLEAELHRYTVQDISFVIRELIALGLPEDAAALTQEVMAHAAP